MDENAISRVVIDSAIKMHKELGPGLLESVYESVLSDLLSDSGLAVQRQTPLSIIYRDKKYENAFRADIVVDDKVIIELKSVEQVHDAHKKQLLTYLRLSGFRLGLLLNFRTELMRHGIYRIVNNLNS